MNDTINNDGVYQDSQRFLYSKSLFEGTNSYCTIVDKGNQTFTDYRHIRKLLTSLLPPHYDKQYRNFCWWSTYNLKSLPSLPYLSSLYKSNNITIDEIHKALNSITDKRNKQRLTCLPAVFMGGFPKSGSTYIYRLLTNHPRVNRGKVKAPHLWRFPFRNEDKPDTLALLTYLGNFNGSSDMNHDSIFIDGSQSLLWDSKEYTDDCSVPLLLREFLPNAKFIIIMRNPIDRLYSDFKEFGMRDCDKELMKYEHLLPYTFQSIASAEITRYKICLSRNLSMPYCARYMQSQSTLFYDCAKLRLTSNFYFIHIQRWLKIFPREQFLFLTLEEIIKDLYGVMKQIWEFIDVPVLSQEKFQLMSAKIQHQSSLYLPMHYETRKMLHTFFHPYNKQLAQLLQDDKYKW
jgi:N-acetylgalactosamine 4-sulfate 6-O-sulfotransferase